MEPKKLRWDQQHGWQPAADTGRLLAVDSWLLQQGSVRGFDLHWQRFEGYAIQLGIEQQRLSAFRSAVSSLLPRDGFWFPRIECVELEQMIDLRLWLRPDPPLFEAASAYLYPPGDPRCQPKVKGPDLELISRIRSDLKLDAASELIFQSPAGLLLEGSYSTLLWWQNGRLATNCGRADTLPGVTVKLLTQVAKRLNTELHSADLPAAEVAGSELWLVNALHGIRPVQRWLNLDLETPVNRERLQLWRGELDRLKQPLNR